MGSERAVIIGVERNGAAFLIYFDGIYHGYVLCTVLYVY